MNIKRAFLAAAAVLMMPGLAMAQSTNTFDTTAVLTGGTGELPVILTCNSGIPIESQMAVTPVNFTQLSVSAGAVCSIVVDNGAIADNVTVTGYTTELGQSATSCEWTITNGNAVYHTCAIAATVSESSFEVTVAWDFTAIDSVTGGADTDIGATAEVLMECQNVFSPSGLTTVSGSAPGGPGAAMPVGLDVLANPISPFTTCSATLVTPESSVEVVSDCLNVELMATSTTPAMCNITATVFFEGIPTLSQYGMAIMVLLMLGVGFVGFRRFV